MKLNIRQFSSKDEGFRKDLDQLLSWESVSDASVQKSVEEIVNRVRTEGDAALVELTNRFDRRSVQTAAELVIEADELAKAASRVDGAIVEALQKAAERVKSYHERQIQPSWQYEESTGTVLGQ